MSDEKYLNMDRFAQVVAYGGVDLVAPVKQLMLPSMAVGSATKLVKHHTSFGGAVSRPMMGSTDDFRSVADDPYALIWFIYGWGSEWKRYAANAIRKMMPAAAEGRDSLDLKYDPDYEFPNPVESQERDGSYRLGSFGHGGARSCRKGRVTLLSGVSCLSEFEDHDAAGFAGDTTLTQMHKRRPQALGFPAAA